MRKGIRSQLEEDVRRFLLATSSVTLARSITLQCGNGTVSACDRFLKAAAHAPRRTQRSVAGLTLDALGLVSIANTAPRMSNLLAWAVGNDAAVGLDRWTETSLAVANRLRSSGGRARKLDAHSIWRALYRTPASTQDSVLAFEWLARLTGMYVAPRLVAPPRNILDIGSGSAGLLAEVLRYHASTEGTAIDFPQPLRHAARLAAITGVRKRLTIVAGDVLHTHLVPGFDVVILSWVLHDYDDARALALLRRSAELLSPDGRVLVVELLRERAPASYSASLGIDVRLLGSRGHERTLDQFAGLARRAGLAMSDYWDNIDFRSVLEFVPARGETADRTSPVDRRALAAARALDAARAHGAWIAAAIGHDGPRQRESDVDVVVVLSRQRSFALALRAICDLLRDCDQCIEAVTVYPTLELATLRTPAGQKARGGLHFLLYPDPWCVARQECPGIVQAILRAGRRGATPRTAAREIREHFDLLEKAANAMILMLGASGTELEDLAAHARRIAGYVAKWAPLRRPRVQAHPTFRDIAGAAAYFRELAGRCER